MLPTDAVWGGFFLLHICIGYMGNSLLLGFYVYTFLTQSHLKKPIDGILLHLTLVNILTITFRLIPDVVSSFGVRHFLNDAGCKAMMFMYRVTRGLSICTTALLSAFQAVTISPGNSKWAWLKSISSGCIYPALLFFWGINLLIYIHIILATEANPNSTVAGSRYSSLYCQTSRSTGNSQTFLSAMVIRDLLFVVPMMGFSLYMVNLIYRHRQRVRHMHSSRLYSQTPPEIKATHTIVLLVSCFVFFYCANNFSTFYVFYRLQKNPGLERITGTLASCYPTICPFVLMKNNKIMSKFTSSLSQMRITFSGRAFQ